MEGLKEKMKRVALFFCVLYTVCGLLFQTVKIAWAFDEWDLKRMIESVISSKIDSYDFDFKRAVRKVVEDNCHVDGEDISC